MKGGITLSKNVNKAKINVEFNEAKSLENINSGESINTLFGKISKVITDFISHIGNSSKHTTSVELTQSEYDALSDDEKNNGTVYYITDANNILQSNEIVKYVSQITVNTDTVKNLWTTSIKKIGHLINFTVNITVKEYSSSAVTLGYLPEAVRPTTNACINSVTNSGIACYIFVDADGKFGFRKMTETTWTEGDGVRFCFSYVTSN